jgi:hypothetical protein
MSLVEGKDERPEGNYAKGGEQESLCERQFWQFVLKPFILRRTQ